MLPTWIIPLLLIVLVLFENIESTRAATSYVVSVTPPSVGLGDTVLLACQINKPTGLTVQWRRKTTQGTYVDMGQSNVKSGCLINPSMDQSNYVWDDCDKPSTISPRTYDFKIIKAGPTDSAEWDCNDFGAGDPSKPVKVKVRVPPATPRVTGLERPVGAGTKHELKCDAHQEGISDPITYRWLKNGVEKGTQDTLIFDPVVKSDAGSYRCEATNAVDTKTSTDTDLEIYYSPLWDPSYPEELNATAKLDQPANMTVHVIANPEATTATWYRYYGPTNYTNLDTDFKQEKVNAKTFSLLIKVVKQSHFGKYKVVVYSPTGASTFIFTLQTPVTLNMSLNYTYAGNERLLTWSPLTKTYAKAQIVYCTLSGEGFQYIKVTAEQQAAGKIRFPAEIEDRFCCMFEIYDIGSRVFMYSLLANRPTDANHGTAVVGGILGGVIILLVITAAVLAVLLARVVRSGQSKKSERTDEKSKDDPEYMNVGKHRLDVVEKRNNVQLEGSQYAELDITAEVIADQEQSTYEELRL